MKISDQIINSVTEFPTLPTIYNELTEVLENPRSTAIDAANIITKDQSATSKILKVANSSIYGFYGKIETISQAIFYIGFQEVRNLILTLGIMDIFKNTKEVHLLNPVDLWKHSIAVGTIARAIGRYLGISKLENYFVAGILHDIGKIFFLKYFPNDFAKSLELAEEKEITIREAETEIFGISHTKIGSLIAERWKLPKTIVNTIEYHYTGTILGKFDLLTCIIHLSNIYARLLNLGNSGDKLVPQPNEEVWNNMSLPTDLFSKIYNKVILDYQESTHLFLLN